MEFPVMLYVDMHSACCTFAVLYIICFTFIELDEHIDIKQFKTMDQFKERTGP